MSEKTRLSIVIPCYNEEAVLPQTRQAIASKLQSLVAQGLVHPQSKIFFIDDGSSDNTWEIINSYARESEVFHGIKLSRNYGHQNALLAGLLSVDGDVVVSMDADLQDDIDAVDGMLHKYLDGAEIVYAVRANRQVDSRFKRMSAQGYYRSLQKMGVELVYNHADFRLMGRNAINALKDFKEVNLFLRGIIPLLGFRTDTVYYNRRARFDGESKYSMLKMLAFAIEGITSFTNVPLRLITALGFLVSLFAFLMIFWVLAIWLFTERAAPGWASTVIPTFFLGGVQLLSIGVVGEYVAKIYMETKRRPAYIIEKVV
jgi:glycosyltransferase involved in cell wall biosynthesis